MTFGAGGHTRRILHAAPNCKVYGVDRDPFAINIAREMSRQKYILIIHTSMINTGSIRDMGY